MNAHRPGSPAVAQATEAGELRIDDELHLTPLAAEQEDPELVKLRAALDHRIGEAQLPELLLEVDTHGYTDFGMALARAAGFDLCPRLKALKERHLFLPRGCEVPEILQSICSAHLDLSRVSAHWDEFVQLTAVYSGHTSAVNALKRLIYTGRVANYQAKREDEMQAVADALSLIANIVMAWNTAQMQVVFDRWAERRSGAVSPRLVGRIAPTRTEGINMRGIFRFPIEKYADALLPSWASPKNPVVEQ